ncbi:MAG: hypothetical protein IPI93_00455 [Sphingobacteriaceae bacterium]|nr:hypothetical protein [Sphingobacteriaceae bacterium]
MDEKIVVSILKREAPIDYENALANYKLIYEVSNAEEIVVLFDGRNLNFEYIPKEVFSCMANNEYNRKFKKFAIIYSGLPQKLMAGLFTTLHKPHFSTKLFSNVNEAFKWLGTSNAQSIIEKTGITL